MTEITETELTSGNGARRVLLTAEVGEKKLWRMWREGSVSTLEKKRALLKRDIELANGQT